MKLEECLAAKEARIADLEDRLAQVESLRGELGTLKAALAEALTGKALLARQ